MLNSDIFQQAACRPCLLPGSLPPIAHPLLPAPACPRRPPPAGPDQPLPHARAAAQAAHHQPRVGRRDQGGCSPPALPPAHAAGLTLSDLPRSLPLPAAPCLAMTLHLARPKATPASSNPHTLLKRSIPIPAHILCACPSPRLLPRSPCRPSQSSTTTTAVPPSPSTWRNASSAAAAFPPAAWCRWAGRGGAGERVRCSASLQEGCKSAAISGQNVLPSGLLQALPLPQALPPPP